MGEASTHYTKLPAYPDTVDRLTPRITETAKYLWFIYIGFTVAETLLLMAGGMSFFDGLNHAFTTMPTGGFSTKNASVAHFDSVYMDMVITIFMVLVALFFGFRPKGGALTNPAQWLTDKTGFRFHGWGMALVE